MTIVMRYFAAIVALGFYALTTIALEILMYVMELTTAPMMKFLVSIYTYTHANMTFLGIATYI
ncbi:hypothetical protein PmNV_114 [Penaeus monodon nudivirus]|uniref:Uncharacterized protein n=1 Tax=Penaeus monodon nudivirus TaxID=1529056 RepID=A0A076FCE9_9VIRU|nr:hypothetical protein PmNV_114 [Penaeus monodon nudivirus]AII15902.1 hypothetical protein PmNV_114 [Penaeus monodon nudivirus]